MSETGDQPVLPLGHDADDIPAPGSERPGLTGIVPALNEEANLEACIESFREICDDVQAMLLVDQALGQPRLGGSRRSPCRSRIPGQRLSPRPRP